MTREQKNNHAANTRAARTFAALRLSTHEQRDQFRALARIARLKERNRVAYRVRISKTSDPKSEETADADVEGAPGGNPGR